MTVLPRQPAPPLDVPLADAAGSEQNRFNLATHKPARFTLLSFYRGYHCQRCRANLQEIEAGIDRFDAAGTDIVAISMDDAVRAKQTVREWELSRVRIGYGLTMEAARDWSLYVSRAIRDHEAPIFNEPALYLVRADGTIQFAVINSMQRMRPYPKEIIEAIERIIEADEPPRGEV